MSKQKIKELLHIAKNPPPAFEDLLTPDEWDYFKGIALGVEYLSPESYLMLVYEINDRPKVDEILRKLEPMGRKFGFVPFVEDRANSSETKAISKADAMEIKKLYER